VQLRRLAPLHHIRISPMQIREKDKEITFLSFNQTNTLLFLSLQLFYICAPFFFCIFVSFLLLVVFLLVHVAVIFCGERILSISAFEAVCYITQLCF
jgi:hypothetical protein